MLLLECGEVARDRKGELHGEAADHARIVGVAFEHRADERAAAQTMALAASLEQQCAELQRKAEGVLGISRADAMLHEPCIVRTRWHSRTLNFAAELSRGEGDREVECCGTISIVELEFSPPNSGKCLVLFDGKKVRWLLHGIDQCGCAMTWALRGGEQGADYPPHPSKQKETPKACAKDRSVQIWIG